MVSKKGNIYFDIVGEGTYMSRRFSHSDREWAPFVPVGSVPIDRYTLEPKVQPGLKYCEYDGAAMVTYSQHRDMEVVGPYSSVMYKKNVVVMTDVSVTTDQLRVALLESNYHMEELEVVDLYPYPPGHCYRIRFLEEVDALDFHQTGGKIYEHFTVRVEKSLIFFRDKLYSTTHLRRGIAFIPRADGTHVIAGFPPGICYRTWSYLKEGISIIMLPVLSYGSLPERPWLSTCSPMKEFKQRKAVVVFATIRDFHLYFGTMVTHSVSWVNHAVVTTEFMDKSTPEPANDMVSGILEVVNRVRVKKWIDVGVTSSYVMARVNDFGVTPGKLRRLFFPNTNTVVWRMGKTLETIEWVSILNIDIMFPGDQATTISVNGRSVAEVYGYIRTTRVGVIDFEGTLSQISPFIRLLENNRIYVEYRYRVGGLSIYFTLVS